MFRGFLKFLGQCSCSLALLGVVLPLTAGNPVSALAPLLRKRVRYSSGCDEQRYLGPYITNIRDKEACQLSKIGTITFCGCRCCSQVPGRFVASGYDARHRWE